MADSSELVAEFIELRTPEDRLPQICARATYHFERGETVAIHADDPDEARDIDEQLWTFRQNSFVPHVQRERAEDPVIEAVVIFSGEPEGLAADVLILAAADGVPDWAREFAHVYDFAQIYDEALRSAARKRFAAYQKSGYRMRFIKPESPE